MLNKIALRNFQCHKSLVLELDKVTTLVGPSDSGKTAVLRALDWLCFNRGRTALLLRRGAPDVTVVAEVDGHQVVRTTKGNAYALDSAVFTAIGRNIPPEVSALLKMSDDNIQRQHDYLFWFTQTGAGLVSCLNRVVDLTKLENWVSGGVSEERTLKTRLGYLTSRKEELTAEYTVLDKYRTIAAELKLLEDASAVIAYDTKKRDWIASATHDYDNVCQQTNLLLQFTAELKIMVKEWDLLQGRINRRKLLQELLLQQEAVAAKLECVRELCSIEVDFVPIMTAQKLQMQLRILIADTENTKKAITVKNSLVADLSDILNGGAAVLSMRQKYNEVASAVTAVSKEYPNVAGMLECLEILWQNVRCADNLRRNLTCYDTDHSEAVAKTNEIASLQNEIQEQTNGLCPICGNPLKECGQ